MADCPSYTTDEMIAHFKAGFHGSTLNDDQVSHGLDAVFLARGLFDGSAPMADGGDAAMTAAEEVLAYLLVEKIGAPDDVSYSPDEAQRIIEQRLAPDPELTTLRARVKELEEGLATALMFIDRASGTALGIAISGKDHPNPDEVLTSLSTDGIGLSEETRTLLKGAAS